MPDVDVKYLTETSAVLAAIGASTTGHNRHYSDLTKGGKKFSSVYIRKEFIARVFCELAFAAFSISQRTSVKNALVVLSQRYSIRSIKIDVIALAHLIEREAAMTDPKTAAVEVARLGIDWLKVFDRVFKSRIENKSGCQIGDAKPVIDYNDMLEDLYSFYEGFGDSVDDCSVNDFVEIGVPTGKGRLLANEPKLQKIDSVKNLVKILDAGTRFVCDECRKIGDVIIALEQPDTHCLVHIDNAFNKFCPFLNRDHLHMKSVIALDNEELGKGSGAD
jgi:hypothetical protein